MLPLLSDQTTPTVIKQYEPKTVRLIVGRPNAIHRAVFDWRNELLEHSNIIALGSLDETNYWQINQIDMWLYISQAFYIMRRPAYVGLMWTEKSKEYFWQAELSLLSRVTYKPEVDETQFGQLLLMNFSNMTTSLQVRLVCSDMRGRTFNDRTIQWHPEKGILRKGDEDVTSD